MRKQLQRLPARCDWLRSACGAPRRAALLLSMSDACDANTLLPADLSCRTAHVPRAQGNTGTSLLTRPALAFHPRSTALPRRRLLQRARSGQLSWLPWQRRRPSRWAGREGSGSRVAKLFVCLFARMLSAAPAHPGLSMQLQVCCMGLQGGGFSPDSHRQPSRRQSRRGMPCERPGRA